MFKSPFTPKYAREGDLIKHAEDGYYLVIDKEGNLLFRM